MNEIVIISGKGGTGKTSLAACFAVLAGSEAVLADCDVDAADMHLLMDARHENGIDFYSGEKAVIDQLSCSSCGICMKECRFNAIDFREGQYIVDPLACEGCGLCSHLCPESSIEMNAALSGAYYCSKTRLGTMLVHARLAPGASNSGKLVSVVKEIAKKYAEKNGQGILLVDGSPGIGCPVISSLSGASYVVLVTEPSQTGFSDLKRVVSLIEKFNLPSACIINKSDLNPGLLNEIRTYLDAHNITQLGELPYTRKFHDAITQGKTVLEIADGLLTERITDSWKSLMSQIKQD
ncbi:MAG: ATP-binding protein [Bacteroidales bacterium]|nr:ATP-binding protein [Bacteroidales bacterium]